VGLHEFAHAYHAQNFHFKGEKDSHFVNNYFQIEQLINTILAENKLETDMFFTKNAFRNKEEFYAETVGLFFEKPLELKEKYSELYDSICLLLNQKLV
jgi:MtfA peptidase